MEFYKYQGAGNDFIMIDNRKNIFPIENYTLVKKLCDRHFGIGADGLILLENDKKSDFIMVYYNSDGNQSTLCGNGGRCLVAFARDLGLIKTETLFHAVDGLHKAKIEKNIVHLKMNDVKTVEDHNHYFFLNTGSPHHIEFSQNIETIDIDKIGSKIRHGSPYFEEGTNVNFVEKINNQTIKIRTYERGVEGETLSCGTGVTAAAIAFHFSKQTTSQKISVKTLGGDLTVFFQTNKEGYTEVYLIGPAEYVFKGKIEI